MSKLCKSTTSSCVIFLLFGVAIMDKEALDPNLSPPPSRGKRPASEPVRSSTPRRQQPKRRASTKNRRRVSFAPDPELTLVRLFSKVSRGKGHSGWRLALDASDVKQADACKYKARCVSKTCDVWHLMFVLLLAG